MKFKDQKIKTKLYIGFGLMILLLLILSASTFISVGIYSSISSSSELLGRIQTEMNSTRIIVREYLSSNNEFDIEKFDSKITPVRENLNSAFASVEDPIRYKKLMSIDSNLTEYEKSFKTVVGINKQKREFEKKQSAIESKIQSNIKILLEYASKNNNSKISYNSAKTAEHLLLASFYQYRYISSDLDTFFVESLMEMSERVNPNLEVLKNTIQKEKNLDLVNEIEKLRNEYMMNINFLREVIFQKNTIIDNKLNVLGPQIGEDADWIKDDMEKQKLFIGKVITYSIITISIFSLMIAFVIIGKTTKSVKAPIEKLLELSKAIVKGDLSKTTEIDQKDEIGDLAKAFMSMQQKLKDLIERTEEITEAIKQGAIDKRARLDGFDGGFHKLLSCVNELCDAFVKPINETNQIINELSDGNLNNKIETVYKGEFDKTKQNINSLIYTLKDFAYEMKTMYEEHKKGNISLKMNDSRFAGFYSDLAKSVNIMVQSHINNEKKAINVVQEFGKGNFDADLDRLPGEKVFINDAIDDVRNNLKMFLQEMKQMSQDHNNGIISSEIDCSKFEGSYAEMALGVNTMVQEHIEIKRQAMKVISEFGIGNFDADLKKLPGEKIFVNKAIDSIRENLINYRNEVNKLIKAGQNGDLTVSANFNLFEGDWRNLVQGINQIFDALTEPINEAGEVLSTMATGDLTSRMKGEYKGDLESLKNDINALGKSLSKLIKQVNESVETTASSALEISSTAEDISASAQQQASQSDEVATAVEEMTKTIYENSRAASRTSEIAMKNGEIANSGSEVVQETISKVKDIAKVVEKSAENIFKLGESSKKIGEIISVIENIANQTNLLALNAAIEAARAGEQGRGFAVVADEVRKLAERTGDATGEIADMIKGIQSDTNLAVEAMNEGKNEAKIGIKLADKAGISLREILSSTDELLKMVDQIASASEQQSATSEEVSKNVVAISSVSDQSAQKIEAVSNTANELANLTESLNNLMSNFVIENSNTSLEFSEAKRHLSSSNLLKE